MSAQEYPQKAVLLVGGALAALALTIGVSGCTAPGTAPSSAATAAQQVGINTPVRDGKFEFVVTSVDTSPTTGGDNPYLQQQAKGVFVNVHLRVTNIGDKAQTFFADNQKLIVAGKEYSATSILDGSLMNEINPGLSTDGVVSFDVPVGRTAEAVKLHDSLFSGGATVRLS
jgi:Domain of unknown function (DUF4352)